MIMMMDKKKIVNQIMGDKEEGKETSPLQACFEELCSAINSGDYESGVNALRACFRHLDAEPHHEGPHEEG